MFVGCVCAQRYPRFVTPASSRPHQTPVVGKLSVVKCGAQDKTTRESREREREQGRKRERDRVGAFACWSCASFCEVSVRTDYTRSGSLTLIKLDKNISNHEGCSCHCCWGPCAAYQERERLLEKLARFEARPYTRFKINKQVKNLQLMRNTCDCSCHMRYSRNTDIPIIIAADIDDASANWISIEMSDAFALRVINN